MKSEENPGKLKEKIVTILERHIDQNAIVSCDRFLPVLEDETREPRQCDVVVETGSDLRKTLTIVEVQDRIAKPTPTEFGGWLVKMSEVGAQHLICVTRAGYPSSIVKKAEKIGPSVRLYTLKQLDGERCDEIMPAAVLSQTVEVVTYGKLHAIKIDPYHPFRMHKDLDPKKLPDPHYKMFWPPGHHEAVSASDVADWHFFQHPKNLAELPHTGELVTVRFGYEGDPPDNAFKFITADGWVPTNRFDVIIEISIRDEPIDWEGHKYEATGKGEVGWIMKGTARYNGVERSVYLPFKKTGDGQYSRGQITIIDDESDDAFFGAAGDVGYKAKDFNADPLG